MSSETSLGRSVLSRRFFRQIAGVSVGLLLAAGAIEAIFGYREALQQMVRLQGLQAQAASAEIEQELRALQQGMKQVQALPWGLAGFGPAERREELHRLLALGPSIVSLTDIDAAGRELIAVSRSEPDRIASLRIAEPVQDGTPAIGFGTPFFDSAGAPRVQFVVPRAGNPAGNTVAVINLRFLGDVVSGLRVADGGEVFVVDAADRLIAHADPTQVLRQRKLSGTSAVVAMRAALAASAPRLEALDGPGLDGARAITTALPLAGTQWLLFVEQPHGQATQAVLSTLQRTLWLVALAGLVAMVASAAFARRMAAPIARLREATASMAGGQLDQRLEVHTGDEIEGLAHDFNTLSTRLQQSYGELESKVVARTAELGLRRDEAERASAAKTRFLASASHDLRQPMHAIGLLVGALRQRVGAGEQRSLVDMTYQAVQSMEVLFGSLLDISKLDAGAIKPKPHTFALHDLMDRAAQVYTPLAVDKGIELRVRRSNVFVHTDAVLLERLIGNLLTNAIRYTHQGGVLLGCRVRGQHVVVQVFDTGVGIAHEHLDIIFEEFVRLDSGTAAGGEQGLGLGLAIVKRTADLLGLDLSVQSRPGRGSVFTVRLDTVAAVPGAPARNDLSADADQRLVGAFVMVVDDDEVNRKATALLLQQWGCLVAEAHNAQAALLEAQQHLRPPDALLTDYRLGGGANGIELIKLLRTQCGIWLPALLVTADVELPQTIDGDIQVLQKPVGTARLFEALSRSMAGQD